MQFHIPQYQWHESNPDLRVMSRRFYHYAIEYSLKYCPYNVVGLFFYNCNLQV
jgi:hypothetical protein